MKYLVIVLVGFSLSSYADFPGFPNLQFVSQIDGDKSAIEINCESLVSNKFEPKKIHCKFFQLRIKYKTDPDEYEKEVAEIHARIEKEKEKNNNTYLKEIQETCEDMKKSKRSIKGILAKLEKSRAPAHRNRTLEVINLFTNICKVKTNDEAMDFYEKLAVLTLQEDITMCVIWPWHWEETFEYHLSNSKHFWQTNASPSGTCGILNISTLAPDDQFWKYSTTRLITTPIDPVSGEKCAPYAMEQNLKRTYIWQDQDHIMNCETITFSLL